MNEIVGTLYFVLAHDSNEDWAQEGKDSYSAAPTSFAYSFSSRLVYLT